MFKAHRSRRAATIARQHTRHAGAKPARHHAFRQGAGLACQATKERGQGRTNGLRGALYSVSTAIRTHRRTEEYKLYTRWERFVLAAPQGPVEPRLEPGDISDIVGVIDEVVLAFLSSWFRQNCRGKRVESRTHNRQSDRKSEPPTGSVPGEPSHQGKTRERSECELFGHRIDRQCRSCALVYPR